MTPKEAISVSIVREESARKLWGMKQTTRSLKINGTRIRKAWDLLGK